MIIFFIHLFLISWASLFLARRYCSSVLEQILATFILLWSNLVVTGSLLSLFNVLGHSVIYFHLSVALSLVAAFLVRKQPVATATSDDTLDHDFLTAAMLPWGALLLLSALSVFILSFAICSFYIPNNWDSLTYHLPRVLLYISQGSLSYFPANNARLSTFPQNETLFRVFLSNYGQPDQLFSFFSLLCWGVGWVAVFVLARRCGISALGSLTGAWVSMMGTQVVAQASATTNDLICAVPVVIGMLYAVKWFRDFRISQAIFAGLAFGLAFGTKLTLLFYGPVIGIYGVIFFVKLYRQTKNRQVFFKITRHLIISAAIAIIFSLPFMVRNIQGIGTPLTHDYDYSVNKPISIRGSLQTMYGFTMQLCLNPFLEFISGPANSTFHGTVRNRLETFIKKHLFSFWDQQYTFSELNVLATDLTEDHVFFGFCGPLLIIAVFFSFFRPQGWKSPVFWISGLIIGWFLVFCTIYKWSLYNQRYFNFLALLSGPAAGLFFDKTNQSRRRFLKTIGIGAFGIVVLCGILFSWNYLMFNSNRNIRGLTGSPFSSSNYPQPTKALVNLLKNEKTFTLFQLGEEHINERIYPIMRLAPKKNIHLTQSPEPNKLNIISMWGETRQFIYSNIPSTAAYAMLPIPQKKTPGISAVGSLGRAPINFFRYYAWNSTQTHALNSDYNNILTMFQYSPTGENRLDHLKFMLLGLRTVDNVRVSLYFVSHDKKILHVLDTNHDITTTLNLEHDYQRLLLEAHSLTTGEIISSCVIFVAPYNPILGDAYAAAPGLNVDLAEQPQSDWLALSGFNPPNGTTSELGLSASREMVADSASIRYENDKTHPLKQIILNLACQPQLAVKGKLVLRWNGVQLDEIQMQGVSDRQTRMFTLPVSPGRNELVLEASGDSGNSNPRLLFSRLQFYGIEEMRGSDANGSKHSLND